MTALITNSYRVVDGKIRNRACEIQVAEHCNLSCKGCSHLSPIVSKHFVEPAGLQADLSLLARHYVADEIRLLGGEPLLHPDLDAVVHAVRESGVTRRICIGTNGLMLDRMPESVWRGVDRIEISLYPGHRPSEAQMARVTELARRHEVELAPNVVARFREPYTEVPNEDPALVGRIFSTCKILHDWRCHTVAHHVFYRCPPSYYLPKVLSERYPNPEIDGLALVDAEDFGDRLLAFISGTTPLASCTHCLGTSGRMERHVQIRRSSFRSAQQRPAAELVSRRQMHPRLQNRGRKPLEPLHRRLVRAARRRLG